MARFPAAASIAYPGYRVVVLALICLATAACSTTGRQGGGSSGGGGYYQDDGPPLGNRGPDPDSVPDAVPRDEPMARTGNNPYTALGKRYKPMRSARGFRQVGYASWYGRKYHGNRTSSGEPYDMFAMTAAHPVLPLPTYVSVRNLSNNRRIVVKVNDRGPFLNDRVIDLSYMAARKLDIVRTGTAKVEVRAVFAGDVPDPARTRNLASAPSAPAPPVREPVRAEAPEPRAPANTVTRVATSAVASMVPTANAAPVTAFLLQAGSFASRDNAERLRARLQYGGYGNVQIQQVQISGRHYHRVQLGPFDSRATAEGAAATVRSFLNAPVSILSVGSG